MMEVVDIAGGTRIKMRLNYILKMEYTEDVSLVSEAFIWYVYKIQNQNLHGF